MRRPLVAFHPTRWLTRYLHCLPVTSTCYPSLPRRTARVRPAPACGGRFAAQFAGVSPAFRRRFAVRCAGDSRPGSPVVDGPSSTRPLWSMGPRPHKSVLVGPSSTWHMWPMAHRPHVPGGIGSRSAVRKSSRHWHESPQTTRAGRRGGITHSMALITRGTAGRRRGEVRGLAWPNCVKCDAWPPRSVRATH